jgi:hypothetical protein
MLQDQRVIYSNNGTLSDISVNICNFRSGSETFDYTTAEDYLFIGSFLPFNHKHIDIGTANDQAAVASVSIWDGTAWNAAVDVIDQTALAGASLAQDGILSWSTDIDEGWTREQESKDVTGLTGTNIYNMYWVRLAWDATLNASTALKFIGQKFSSDADLYDIYPDLDNTTLRASFESGTDWEEQHYIAAQHIARDLKKDHSILSADQIIDFDLFKETSVHATAAIIYWGLGQETKHAMAKDAYKTNLKMGFLNLDYNQDGRINPAERTIIQGYLSR